MFIAAKVATWVNLTQVAAYLPPSPALPVNGEGVGRRPPPVYGGIEGGRLDAIPNFE
ncbi:hypothetical protein CCP3SC1_390024 [Gammaproteobacteria bacterium]